MKLSYKKPVVQLTDEDSSAFAIMSKIREAIIKAGATEQEVKEYREKSTSGDYDNLLRVATDYADCE